MDILDPPDTDNALGDRDGPFPDTTALNILEHAHQAGLITDPDPDTAAADPQACHRYPGCRSAATAGDIMARRPARRRALSPKRGSRLACPNHNSPRPSR